MLSPVSKLLVALGYGFVAATLAKTLRARGWRIVGTSRSARDGLLAFPGDLNPLAEALQAADAVLCSIPPEDDGCPAFRAVAAHLGAPWLGYLSTTGVYGDHGGRWVFEWTPRTPQSVEAQRRALAEDQWLSLRPAAHVFRLPGIYGPGRSPFDRLRAGEARRIVKPGQVFSRIHVEDLAHALDLSIDRPNPGRIYHVCDDAPAPPQDVTAFAAELLGLPVPPEIPLEAAALSPMARRFYAESKRVSNARLKAELGWRPLFADYRTGLRAIRAAETRGSDPP